MTERLHFHFSLSCIGEGNGNPLQCSCLENPSDGETDNGETENRPMDTVEGEEGEGEMYKQSNTEIYNSICKIDSQWAFAI